MSGREVTSVEGWKAGRVLTVCWEDSAALALNRLAGILMWCMVVPRGRAESIENYVRGTSLVAVGFVHLVTGYILGRRPVDLGTCQS